MQHLQELVTELNEGEDADEGEVEAASGLLALFSEELELAQKRDSLVSLQRTLLCCAAQCCAALKPPMPTLLVVTAK